MESMSRLGFVNPRENGLLRDINRTGGYYRVVILRCNAKLSREYKAIVSRWFVHPVVIKSQSVLIYFNTSKGKLVEIVDSKCQTRLQHKDIMF